MNTEQPTESRRVLAQYSVEDRERLTNEWKSSGQSKKDFCEQRGVNLGTFYKWTRKSSEKKRTPKKPKAGAFAEVRVPLNSEAPIEIAFPSGVRIAVRHHTSQGDLVALVRGLAGC